MPSEGELLIELHGDLAGILACATDEGARDYGVEQRALQIKMVAGACNPRELTLSCPV